MFASPLYYLFYIYIPMFTAMRYTAERPDQILRLSNNVFGSIDSDL
jgi:hypothetical protein